MGDVASAWKAEVAIMIPELALAEAAQVLWKKEKEGYINKTEVDEIISAILELPMEIVGHYDLLEDAISIARRNNLTVYDAIFLALASKRKAELVTADQKLRKAFESN